MDELLKQMEVQAKKDVAALLKNQIGIGFEAGVKVAADKLKELIPGQVDDAVIDMIAPKFAELMKEQLLLQIAKLEA